MRKLFFVTILSSISSSALGQAGVPLLNISENAAGGTEYSLTLQVLILMTVLTLLPSLLIMMTSFVRIIIVMSLLRQAIGTAQTPPNIVLIGISLFLTFFIMSTILQTVYNDAAVPYIEEQISAEEVELFAQEHNLVPADVGDLESIVEGIVMERLDFVKERGMGAMGPLMGVVMGACPGVDGKEVSAVLRTIIQRHS